MPRLSSLWSTLSSRARAVVLTSLALLVIVAGALGVLLSHQSQARVGVSQPTLPLGQSQPSATQTPSPTIVIAAFATATRVPSLPTATSVPVPTSTAASVPAPTATATPPAFDLSFPPPVAVGIQAVSTTSCNVRFQIYVSIPGTELPVTVTLQWVRTFNGQPFSLPSADLINTEPNPLTISQPTTEGTSWGEYWELPFSQYTGTFTFSDQFLVISVGGVQLATPIQSPVATVQVTCPPPPSP